MSIRKVVRDLSSTMNGLPTYKGGKPQMTLAQRLAKRIEVATWEAPKALRTRAAKIVLDEMRTAYPVLNLDKILVSGERSLQDVLIRTVKAHGGLGDLDAAGAAEDIRQDLRVMRAIAEAGLSVRRNLWEADSPAWQTQRLRALDEAGDRIAPNAIGWTGLEDFHDRCYAHHVRRAIAFELSLRDVKRSVTPESDDADFAM